jgi:hypothetical protein
MQCTVPADIIWCANQQPSPGIVSGLAVLSSAAAVRCVKRSPSQEFTVLLLLLLLTDHYAGITENWSAGPIYCSPITAALVQQITSVHRQFLHPLELHEPHQVQGDHSTAQHSTAQHSTALTMVYVAATCVDAYASRWLSRPLAAAGPPAEPTGSASYGLLEGGPMSLSCCCEPQHCCYHPKHLLITDMLRSSV